MLREIVCRAYGIPFRVRQLTFNGLMVPTLFMQKGGGHAPKPVPCHFFLGVPHSPKSGQYRVFAHWPFFRMPPGKMYLGTFGFAGTPSPVNGCNSFRIFKAWEERGTICCSRIFMRSAGMRHSPFSKSISRHSAFRSSPGLTKTMGARR